MINPFQWKNGKAMTPEEVERQRELANAALGRAGDTSPVGHWTQGAARVIDTLGGVLKDKRASKAEAAGLAGADAYVQSNPVLAALLGGGGGMSAPVSGIPFIGGGSPAPVAPTPAGPNMGTDVSPEEMAAISGNARGDWNGGTMEPDAFSTFGLGGASGGYDMGASAAPDPSTDMAGYIKSGLVERGLPEHVADGFVMNFQDESGLNPGINEIAPLVPGSRGGFGLYQLTGPRRRAYEAFAAERGVPLDDVDAQLDFLMTELQGPEAEAARLILGAGNSGEAGAAIVREFLRPAEEHKNSRAAKYLGGDFEPMAGGYSGGGMSPGGSPIPMSGGGANSMAAISAALSDPWVAKKYGPVLQALMGQEMKRGDMQYEAQLRQSDPMYQAQLDALTKPATPEPINVGGVLLDPVTYQPIFDSRTPEAGFAMLAPAEIAALGLPPGAYQRGGDGKITKIGGDGVVVNNNMGADKFDEAFAKGDAATIETVNNAGLAAQRNLGRIDQLESVLNETPTGMGASLAQTAGEWGINTEGLSEIQAAQALINSLVPEQRQPGSGPMSDADLALFKQSLPRIINQPGGNQIIIDTMRAIAQYDAEGAAIVQRMRLPPDDPNYLDRGSAFAALQARANPLEQIKENAVTGGAPNGLTDDDMKWLE